MKYLLWSVCVVIGTSSTVQAQNAELLAPRSDNYFAPSVETSTQHESGYPQYETPRQLVFRNAALRGAQRRERMAINARFGYSPSRPPTSTMPFMGSPIAPPTSYGAYVVYPGFVFPRPYGLGR